MSHDANELEVREPWHETRQGTWSMSLVGGGITVRVAQRKAGGAFQRIIVLNGRQDWSSLRTADREEAEARARMLLHELLTLRAPAGDGQTESVGPRGASVLDPAVPPTASDPVPRRREALRLDDLRAAFEASGEFTRLPEKTKSDYRSWGRILVASMGPDTDVTRLDNSDASHHEVRRRAGGIVYDAPGTGAPGLPMQRKVTRAVRTRAVEADLKLLKQWLKWGVDHRRPDGEFYLAEFPIRGLKIPKEEDLVRPFADYPRFCTLLQSIQQLAATAEAEANASHLRHYRLLELALVLVEATGRRIKAVTQLRRSDFHLNPEDGFSTARVTWRGAADKKKKTRTVPLPRKLGALLWGLLRRLRIVGEAPLFPQVRRPERPMNTTELYQWFAAAERAAGLEKLAGGVWHAYRRKWAKERKHLPVKDVMAAGGWEDIDTFLNSYNEPDEDTMLAVMEEPDRRRAAAAGMPNGTEETAGRAHSSTVGGRRIGTPGTRRRVGQEQVREPAGTRVGGLRLIS